MDEIDDNSPDSIARFSSNVDSVAKIQPSINVFSVQKK